MIFLLRLTVILSGECPCSRCLRTVLRGQKIRTHDASKQELDDLRDAIDLELADAALQTATMAMACSGYRTSGMGHHQTTFEAAELALGTGSAPLTAYFDACRSKRNTVDYDLARIATDTEATEMLKRASEFLTLTEAWIAQNYPPFKQT